MRQRPELLGRCGQLRSGLGANTGQSTRQMVMKSTSRSRLVIPMFVLYHTRCWEQRSPFRDTPLGAHSVLPYRVIRVLPKLRHQYHRSFVSNTPSNNTIEIVSLDANSERRVGPLVVTAYLRRKAHIDTQEYGTVRRKNLERSLSRPARGPSRYHAFCCFEN